MSLITKTLLSVVFPTFCPVCNKKLTNTQDEICEDCLSRLPRTNEVTIQGNMTEDKFQDFPNFIRGAAWLQFSKNSEVSNLIHKFKYKKHPQIGYNLAREAVKEYIPWDFFNTIDVIIPIPLHPKRLRERGFNQSEWIARGLSEETGIPCDTDHLKRIVDNAHQVSLIGLERSQNVNDIFEVNHPEELYRKHILLVDDVITTGATLRSCIMATIPVRGCQISVFALTKAEGRGVEK
ncbi:MAG: ComF family protein [Paludibacteraceae bacterium]|nr:ComF family protein [Paludibacteraceae bacterium]